MKIHDNTTAQSFRGRSGSLPDDPVRTSAILIDAYIEKIHRWLPVPTPPFKAGRQDSRYFDPLPRQRGLVSQFVCWAVVPVLTVELHSFPIIKHVPPSSKKQL